MTSEMESRFFPRKRTGSANGGCNPCFAGGSGGFFFGARKELNDSTLALPSNSPRLCSRIGEYMFIYTGALEVFFETTTTWDLGTVSIRGLINT